MAFEDRLLPILQNIEFGIVSVYRENPNMLDHQALDAVEATLDYFIAKVRGRAPRDFNLDPLALAATESIKSILKLTTETRNELEPHLSDKDTIDSINEIIQALKTVKSSITKWTKQNGRQGYLNFVVQYVI